MRALSCSRYEPQCGKSKMRAAISGSGSGFIARLRAVSPQCPRDIADGNQRSSVVARTTQLFQLVCGLRWPFHKLGVTRSVGCNLFGHRLGGLLGLS
jgi:hypothetical protein